MTQSGQGEQPSARPAREGIVLPSDGGEPLLPGRSGGVNGSSRPAGEQTWGQPWGPGQPPQAQPPAQTAQTWGGDAGQQWGAPQQPASAPAQEWGGAQAQPSWESSDTSSGWSGAPGSGGAHAHVPGAQPLPQATHAAPLPPAADEGATQYIPPVAAADEGATQYIPPVAPGALPPEIPADDSTRYLGRAVGTPAGGRLPHAAGPDAQATQYLPPVTGQSGPAPYGMAPGAPGGDRHTPAEFDNLFRHDTAAGHDSTQHLPRIDAPDMPGGPGAGPAVRYDDDGGGRTRSKIPLIAAAGVGIIVLGIGAGALLSGGGADGKSDNSKNVSATGPAANASTPGSSDPAKQQAVALDKLLADSGNSRDSVINAVAEVKSCNNLGQAATDLRNAATQRSGLVDRLSALSIDKLPSHSELTTALTNAWRASASADTHYAAWADQVSGNKKACHKGHARRTPQTAEGDRASGTASGEKTKAARLWNAIAQKYGLTQRQPTQL